MDRASNLVRKLENLSPEQMETVEEFIEFLRTRGQDRALVQAAGNASESAFRAVWDNPEDDAYDSI